MSKKNPKNNIIAGLYGWYSKKYLRVEMTWVNEHYRNQSLGTQLFQQLDIYARSKGCQYIQLDTFDFQARPFYEKLGFACIGTIPKWIEGRDCHFMRKKL